MFNRSQFDSCGSGEVRVQAQYVNRELDFIDDALAGRLVSSPKFEIFYAVVVLIAVPVMYAFVVSKQSAQRFFHNVAVFKFFASAADAYAQVARRMRVPVFVNRSPFAALPTAFLAAELLAVVVTGRPAVFESKHPANERLLAPTACEQWGRDLSHGGQCITVSLPVKEFS